MEKDVKKAVQDYLIILKAQGKLFWLRLNAGMLVMESKDRRRAINLCQPGTADYLVLRLSFVEIAVPVSFTGRQGTERIMKAICQTIFLELKAPGKKQTKAQREFQDAVEVQGAEYWLIREFEDLKRRMR